jgi:GWxTD domain-containing protein
MNAIRFSIVSVALAAALAIFAADQRTTSSQLQRETVARPLSERQKKRNEERLAKELQTPYRKWLNEDVAYIITPEERDAFKRFETDEEREQFIEQFWLRRDPTPDSVENEFKEEHYRRIAYANERFASGIPGWKTDRGRIYITFGPPDEIEDHSSGGTYQRPWDEGGGSTSTFPFQIWRYRYIEDIGSDILIEFVDPTMTGEFRMTMDPSEKDALLHVPNAGLTALEEMGITSKDDRFSRTDGTHLGIGDQPMSSRMNVFNRLEQFAKLQKAPAVKFKDLEAAVESRITYDLLPMRVRTDFFPITDTQVSTNVTLQFDYKDLQFSQKDGVPKATVNILGKITTMSRRPVTTFEDTVSAEVPKEYLEEYSKNKKAIYQKSVPLAPGLYRLDLVAKDVVANTMTTQQIALTVPQLDSENLSSSSLILADMIEPVPMKTIGMGQFVIGGSKVRPRLDEVFKRDEKLGIYMKVYNFAEDEGSRKPSGSVQYEVLKAGVDKPIIDDTEDLTQIANAAASQVTIQKLLPLKTLDPGQYTIRLKVTDKIRNKVLTQSAQFTVI